MGKPQIAIRIEPSLLEELNSYVERTGTSKTDVVVSAIATYLSSGSKVPLSQRVTELEIKVEEMQILIQKVKTKILEV
jgi:hypothetical protein